MCECLAGIAVDGKLMRSCPPLGYGVGMARVHRAPYRVLLRDA